MEVRAAQEEEFDALAKVWHDAWRDAHAALVPDEFARVRNLDEFRSRIPALVPDLRVIGEPGKPVGLSVIKGDELYQLFVASEARGTGVAQALIADVEQRLAANGVETAWLACAVGNHRAARFYEKSGWHVARTVVHELPVPEGVFKLDVWRYEKHLATSAGPTDADPA